MEGFWNWRNRDGVRWVVACTGNQPVLTLTGLFIMGAVGAFIVATNPAILADEMGNHSPIGVSEKSDRRKKRIKILEVSNESAIHRWHRNHQLQLFKIGDRKRL
jgi:hypothetical protein